MAKADALTQLRDIHLPDPVNWWLLAPGWYVLILLVLIVMVAIAYLFHKKYQHALAKNQALNLLNTYKEQYEKDNNAQVASARVSELLRRVALVYFSRDKVASLHGDDWVAFLNETGEDVDFTPVKSMLLDSPFKTAETVNLKPLMQLAQQWIKQRGTPCSS